MVSSLVIVGFSGIFSIVMFYCFFRHPFQFKFRQILKFNGFFNLLKSGSLSAFQSILTIVISLLSLFLVGLFGKNWSAAYAIVLRLEMMLIPIIFGIGGALIVLVGTNFGAGYSKTTRLSMERCEITVLLISIISLVLLINPNLWTKLFTGDDDLILISNEYFQIMTLGYPFFALELVYTSLVKRLLLFFPVIGTLMRLVAIVTFYKILDYLNH